MKDFDIKEYYSDKKNIDIGVILIGLDQTYQKKSNDKYHVDIINQIYINNGEQPIQAPDDSYDIDLRHNEVLFKLSSSFIIVFLPKEINDYQYMELSRINRELKSIFMPNFKIAINDSRFPKNYYENLDSVLKMMYRYLNNEISIKDNNKRR